MSATEPAAVGLDPDWIGAAIATPGRVPISVDFEGFIGTGQMSRNARFRVTWADGEGPASVVVKLPSAEPNTRAVSFEHGIYRRECEFYRAVAPLVDVCAPAALAVHHDEAGRDFAIVLEDLTGSEQGDQFSEPTPEQIELAVEQAVALQAPVWGDVQRPAFAVYHEDPDERAARAAVMIPLFLKTVFERLGSGLDPEVSTLLERFADSVGSLPRRTGTPTTLVHGDFRPDNFMFAVEPDAPPIAVVDWQTLGLGLGVTDIAYLLGAAVTPERRREIEHGVLTRYIDGLGRRGVAYAREQCERDYALGSLHGIAIAITATVMADETERGDALFTLMLNRHGRHALDVEILDRLDEF